MMADKDLDLDTALIMVLGGLSILAYVCFSLPLGTLPGLLLGAGFYFPLLVGSVFISHKLHVVSRELGTLHLGFEGERYVGQKLTDDLMPHGFRVYHDIVLERNGTKFNVDHVVVGPNGVFAVETKTWRVPRSFTGDEERKVTLSGGILEVPKPLSEKESEKALKQAKRNAAAIHDEVFGMKNTTKRVIPVLALPGWKIDLQQYGEVAVINARESLNYFSKAGNCFFPDEVLEMIIATMERLASMNAHESPAPTSKK
jgi:hypothetical protein